MPALALAFLLSTLPVSAAAPAVEAPGGTPAVSGELLGIRQTLEEIRDLLAGQQQIGVAAAVLARRDAVVPHRVGRVRTTACPD